MPILDKQTDLFPAGLLEQPSLGGDARAQWWTFYLLSRREKDFMRRLQTLQVPFYGPTIAKRSRSPSGRMRTSFVPLFPGYVFVYGGEEQRVQALTTNCVSRWLPVPDGRELSADLRQIQRLIGCGAPLTPESRLEPGEFVRVRKGPFAGLEGVIVKRHGEARLVVAVRFLQQGASILLEDYEVEAI